MLKSSKYHLLALLLILFSSEFASAQSEKKVAAGILIDNTGSLRSQFDQVIAFGKGVARHLSDKGPVSVFTFANERERDLKSPLIASGTEWSEDQEAIESYLDDLFVRGGQTTLLDGIRTMARDLTAKVNGEKDALSGGVIVLITDGEDRASRVKDNDLIKELQSAGIKVFAIGLTRELENDRGIILKSKRGKAEDLLKKITKESGGRAVFPKSRGLDVNQLVAELFAAVAP